MWARRNRGSSSAEGNGTSNGGDPKPGPSNHECSGEIRAESTIDVVEDNDEGNLAGDTESVEANNNVDMITVDCDDDGNFIGGGNGAEPHFQPAPRVISMKISRSNRAFFATKSTSSSGSGEDPVIDMRQGGHQGERKGQGSVGSQR